MEYNKTGWTQTIQKNKNLTNDIHVSGSNIINKVQLQPTLSQEQRYGVFTLSLYFQLPGLIKIKNVHKIDRSTISNHFSQITLQL